MLALAISLISSFLVILFFSSLLVQIFKKEERNSSIAFLTARPFLFFYKPLFEFFFKEPNELVASAHYSRHLAQFAYGVSSFFLAYTLKHHALSWIAFTLVIVALAFIYLFICELIPISLSAKKIEKVFVYGSLPTSIYLTLILPIIYPFLKVSEKAHKRLLATRAHQLSMREKVYELLQESLPSQQLDAQDKAHIEAIIRFKRRVVREVMVPRVKVFALSMDMTIKEATQSILEEKYSRIPLYDKSLDKLSGVLYFKDFLNVYVNSGQSNDPSMLDKPLSTLAKEVLYTPETRKVSHLLQEFLQKQQHLAVVVDEFGSVEGIVTIEDLLEEIVGEIEDEYDDEKSTLFVQQHDGFLVDGQMTLYEIEQYCNLKIPQEGDYDTLGGYIIHKVGSIPQKGLVISCDQFDIEVISSNEKQVIKAKIIPRSELSL